MDTEIKPGCDVGEGQELCHQLELLLCVDISDPLDFVGGAGRRCSSEQMSQVFDLVWQARCDVCVWKVLQAEYAVWLTKQPLVVKLKSTLVRGL